MRLDVYILDLVFSRDGAPGGRRLAAFELFVTARAAFPPGSRTRILACATARDEYCPVQDELNQLLGVQPVAQDGSSRASSGVLE